MPRTHLASLALSNKGPVNISLPASPSGLLEIDSKLWGYDLVPMRILEIASDGQSERVRS